MAAASAYLFGGSMPSAYFYSESASVNRNWVLHFVDIIKDAHGIFETFLNDRTDQINPNPFNLVLFQHALPLCLCFYICVSLVICKCFMFMGIGFLSLSYFKERDLSVFLVVFLVSNQVKSSTFQFQKIQKFPLTTLDIITLVECGDDDDETSNWEQAEKVAEVAEPSVRGMKPFEAGTIHHQHHSFFIYFR